MEAEGFQPEGPADEQQSASTPLLREEVRTCRIERWRGYVTSRFFVVDDDGAVLESRPFRWRQAAPPPETASARAAYDELVGRLEAEGWTFLADGTPWYRSTFARVVAVPLEAGTPLEPAQLSVPAAAAPPAPPPPLREQEIGRREGELETEPEPATESNTGGGGPETEGEPEPVAGLEVVAGQPPQARPPRWRRPRSLLVAIGLGALAASGTVFAVHAADARPEAAHSKRMRPARYEVTRPVRKPALVFRKAASTPRLVHLMFVARGNGSWIEARRGSSSGRVLYSGILEPGRRLQFSGPRLWVELGAAGNLSINVNGKPIALEGTFVKLFRPGVR